MGLRLGCLAITRLMLTRLSAITRGRPSASFRHPLVPAAIKSVPPLDHADATLASGTPFLAVANKRFFCSRLRSGSWWTVGDADALDALALAAAAFLASRSRHRPPPARVRPSDCCDGSIDPSEHARVTRAWWRPMPVLLGKRRRPPKQGRQRVCIPNRSTKSPERKREQKKRGSATAEMRTGCEGRISVFKRRTDLIQPVQGDAGMKRWSASG